MHLIANRHYTDWDAVDRFAVEVAAAVALRGEPVT